MYGFSAADGFVDVNQGVEDMIRYLANEPSLGLFYVQQHAQNAMPNVLDLNDKILEKTHNTMLQTEDLEDSICCVKSMSECGFHIVDEMVKDINKSLHIMSTSRPRKGLLRSSSRGFQVERGNLQAFSSFSEFSGRGQLEVGDGRGGYLSAVFSSVKQKAAMLRWSQIDPMLQSRTPASSSATPSSSMGEEDPVGAAAPSSLEMEGDGLPLSSQIITLGDDTVPDNFEKFKSEQEAKLKEWLEEVQDHGPSTPQGALAS
ncbi:unnamed protein product [Spirodela intermedia]|uniref:Uncharacterized protein n=1 Tax=Spirodela intermedia TaxID=51605 RepID=A0A7I8K5Z3_SPIIN|nr:unnamed protein product [Spirodela intermedia]